MLRIAALIVLLATPAFAAEAPRQVVLQQNGRGWVLTDEKHMTLYTSEKDVEPGKSTCNTTCAKQWPPLLVTRDADRAGGEWSTIAREDGTKQWAFRDKPLYLYNRDRAPGDANGDGMANLWIVAFKPIPTPPGIGVQRTSIGFVLSDQKNMTLYSFDGDKPDGSGCDIRCTRTWAPMFAPAMARGVGDWTVEQRKDGSPQWAFKGKPVYRYAHDAHPRETLGDKAEKGWRAVVLDPPLPNPAWVTVQPSDAGELLADKDGRTLYTWDAQHQYTKIKGTEERPIFDRPEDWSPVTATATDKPVGNWSVLDRAGIKQWAYRGMPIYTNKLDESPGDLYGVRGGDFHFHPITLADREI